MKDEIIDVKAEEVKDERKKVFITNFQAPGDVLMLTSAVRDLCNEHKDKYRVNVNTTAMQIWENNPYLDKGVTESNADLVIKGDYQLIHRSNTTPYHFIHGFRKDLEKKLDIVIQQGDFKPDVHISDAEKSWFSQIHEITGKDLKFWIISAGTKRDFTAKMWEFTRFQKVVDHFKDRITFVQVGEKGHGHPALKNVIDLRGRTDTRQLIRLVYHSSGIFCGVTFLMHLAAGVETRRDRCWKTRPAVVLAGGREPAQWEMYPYHQYLHRCSALSCCDLGGCWKSRVAVLNDGDKEKNNSVCVFPTKVKSGQTIPRCLDMISEQDAIRAVELYDLSYEFEKKSFKNTDFNLIDFLNSHPEYNAVKNGNDINNCEWMRDIFPESVLKI